MRTCGFPFLLRSLPVVLVGVCALSLSGCGYSLAGRGNFLPDYIAVIAIPTFENRSDQPSVEELFTLKVVEEFNSRGRYRIQADEAGADAVLEGVVLSMTSAPSVLEGRGNVNDANQASTYTVVVRSQVEFKDLVQNDVIWSSNNFAFRDDYEIGENPEEFFDQEGLTLQRLSEEFAKSLVSSILEAF
jgi:hypothetical protein